MKTNTSSPVLLPGGCFLGKLGRPDYCVTPINLPNINDPSVMVHTSGPSSMTSFTLFAAMV